MNTKVNEQVVIVLSMIMVLALSACGTLQIDTEPTASGAEVGRTTSEPSQAPTVLTVEATNAIDEVIPTPVEAAAEADKVEEVIEPLNKASEIIELDETWNQFIDYRLGFSIRFPKEMVTFRGSCTWNEEQGSFRPELALVPVQIFEDTNAVYITAEYYYELAGERKDGGVSYYDECNLVTNSLELLRDPDSWKEPYWQLVVEEVRNDGELDSFIKERYGPGCALGEQVPSLQDGVYDVKIQGDGKELEESQCPINYRTVIKYFPTGGKVVAWDRGQANSFPADVNYSVTYDQEMENSFRFLTETSSETGVEPLETVGYSNEETGISFSYPAKWTMEEEANVFILRNGSIMLRIAYRRAGEQVALWTRTGIPAGDFTPLDDPVSFLGQTLAKVGLVYEDRLKMVFYGGPPVSIVETEAMEFNITLEDQESDYLTLDIPDDVVAEAEAILASFEVESTQGGSPGELLTYENPEYGFAFIYPPSWSLAEVNDEDFVGPGSRSVQLSQGTVKLVIGYRRASEETMIMGGGAPAGEFEVRGTTQIFGQDVERTVLVFEGKDKAVMYGQPGTPISAGGLEFITRLEDFAQIDYGEIELSQSMQDEADMILSSLAIFEVEMDSGQYLTLRAPGARRDN